MLIFQKISDVEVAKTNNKPKDCATNMYALTQLFDELTDRRAQLLELEKRLLTSTNAAISTTTVSPAAVALSASSDVATATETSTEKP